MVELRSMWQSRRKSIFASPKAVLAPTSPELDVSGTRYEVGKWEDGDDEQR